MPGNRRDSKHRILRRGESIRADGKYQFKYSVNGKPHFVYSWRLEPTDKLPIGKKPCLSLRELERQIGYDLENRLDPTGKNVTVMELVKRYIATRRNVRASTKTGYQFVVNLLGKYKIAEKKISTVRTSDAKLFLIKLQDDGRRYSTVKTVRGVLRPAFQMAVDDDALRKNPFDFQLANVVVNDSVTREAITREQMRNFLKFIHDDNCYCKYYEAVYILFHTGLRISEFCGLTIGDIDLRNRVLNIDHQLQRLSNMQYSVTPTKTNAGTRRIPITEDVARCFQGILEDREPPEREPIVDGYSGFLYLDKDGLPQVAMHWEHRFKHMVNRYNEIFRIQLPVITPHVCRHTYCSNMAKSGMNPKTLQYLMGHSEIGVTMNTYTHLGLEDAIDEVKKMEAERARAEIEQGSQQNKEPKVTRRMLRVV